MISPPQLFRAFVSPAKNVPESILFGVNTFLSCLEVNKLNYIKSFQQDFIYRTLLIFDLKPDQSLQNLI
jgi:hypothetical protein